jgi:hypothetical protein
MGAPFLLQADHRCRWLLRQLGDRTVFEPVRWLVWIIGADALWLGLHAGQGWNRIDRLNGPDQRGALAHDQTDGAVWREY